MTAMTIFEMGPRDGLQNEVKALDIATRLTLIEKLRAANCPHIEVGSFVSPKWVPQMANTDTILEALPHEPFRFPVLVPNMKGLQAAITAGADHVAVFGAASETFSHKNINCSIAESLERFAPVMAMANAENIRIRGYISCVLGCPYEGEVPVSRVVEIAEWMLEHGAHDISLGDTIGVGTAYKARSLIKAVKTVVPVDRIGLHFHDTYGQALANILSCLEEDISIIDASVGGLGGCPYAKGASGNVASEDVVYMLEGLGINTGIDLDSLIRTGQWIGSVLERANGSKVGRARI